MTMTSMAGKTPVDRKRNTTGGHVSDHKKNNSSPLGLLISSNYDLPRHFYDASALLLQSNSEILPAYLSRAPTPGYDWRSHSPFSGFQTTQFFGCFPKIAEGLSTLPFVVSFV